MIDRRTFLAQVAALAGATALTSKPALAEAHMTYDQIARSLRAPLQPEGGLKELVRFASLAANSHNTQPWTFTLSDKQVAIAPDLARRCPAVDPDDHHVFVSLGCAAENLERAAAAMGLKAHPSFVDDRVQIPLEPMVADHSVLLDVILRRQCTRAAYDGKPVGNDALRLLEQAGTIPGVSVMLITDDERKASVSDYVVQGNTVQMRDPAFLTELKSWMRFNEADAAIARDGLFSRSSGNPALPAWLARAALPFFFTEAGENDKYRAHIQSSAGLAVFVCERNDKAHWVEVGRACQRFALQATALGLKYAFVNQPVEVPALRKQFAAFLGIGDRLPDLIVRFGAGPELPQSLRRPVEHIIV
jgi:nitroreductase